MGLETAIGRYLRHLSTRQGHELIKVGDIRRELIVCVEDAKKAEKKFLDELPRKMWEGKDTCNCKETE